MCIRHILHSNQFSKFICLVFLKLVFVGIKAFVVLLSTGPPRQLPNQFYVPIENTKAYKHDWKSHLINITAI